MTSPVHQAFPHLPVCRWYHHVPDHQLHTWWEKLQDDLTRLEAWEKEWLTDFHSEKCNVLMLTKKKNKIHTDYKLHGQTLVEEESAKYLGLTISNGMMWNANIGKTVAKGNSSLWFLKRNLKIKSPEGKEKAYKALVCPTLKYCSKLETRPCVSSNNHWCKTWSIKHNYQNVHFWQRNITETW